MRKLALGTALSGALALSALAVPSAQALTPDITFSNVVVNSGKAITVGTTNTVTVPVTYTITRSADVQFADVNTTVLLYRGTSVATAENILGPGGTPTCTAVDDTTQNCTGDITIDPQYELFEAADATTWKSVAEYERTDGDGYDYVGRATPATATLKRAAKLTTNATPEPVAKGKTLTVKGNLTRANWATGSYSGYTSQSVTLQFKAAGSDTYTNVKTVTSGTAGALSTTVTASVDGSYRYTFAGTSTTAAKTSTADFVDVQ
ncbi:hypothetical protein ACFS5L_03920 [Streptomyces phyllanthi]|uniref:Calcium-binding protein n=1 Tax=Streptomyces phyllanthi TaxID=1803180 RepID=A0A5N8W5V7_9ACTN|nr:hypothetical protein [Streptomyces phyllanthi]MPY41728.1 hypothetical protein [Streptomyces phyllanthi]